MLEKMSVDLPQFDLRGLRVTAAFGALRRPLLLGVDELDLEQDALVEAALAALDSDPHQAGSRGARSAGGPRSLPGPVEAG